MFQYGKYEQMNDDCSVSFYGIVDGQRLVLKNPHYIEKLGMGDVSNIAIF